MLTVRPSNSSLGNHSFLSIHAIAIVEPAPPVNHHRQAAERDTLRMESHKKVGGDKMTTNAKNDDQSH